MSAIARLLRAGGGAVDVGATAVRSFDASFIKNLDPSTLGRTLKNLDPGVIAGGIKKLPSDQLKRVVNGMDSTKLLDVMRRADDIQIRRITDSMGPGALSGLLKKADPSQLRKITNNADPKKLADSLKLLDPASFKRVTGAMDPKTLKKVTDIDPKFFGTQVNLRQVSTQAKQAAQSQLSTALRQTKKVPVDPKSAEAVVDSADTIGDVAKKTGLPAKQVENAADATADVLKNSDAGMEAVEKMGFLKKMGKDTAKFTKKNWLKIGGGVTLLCMMYNTSNPFKALERGLRDTGRVVRGLKEAADDFASGLGGILSLLAQLPAFLTSNWWVCVVSCICIILLSILSAAR